MKEEKRGAERHPVDYTALLCSPHGACSVQIKDLSRTGLAIIFPHFINVEEGEAITLHFFARDTGTLVTKLDCTIVRRFKYDGHLALGAAFDNMDIGIETIADHLEGKNNEL